MLEFDEETHQALMDACLDDSTKIIRYMEEKEKQSRPYNRKRSIASTCSSTPFSAIIVSHYTESKKLSTQLF